MPIHGFPGNVISATPPSVTPAGASGVFTTEQQMQYQAAGNWPMAATQISRSLRFNSADSANLNRTWSTPTNAKIGTLSFWCKRSKLGDGSQVILQNSNNAIYCGFDNNNTGDDKFGVYLNSNTTKQVRVTTQVFRDASAWYHFVLAIDTTDGTAANRLKLYVNGVQVSDFSTSNTIDQNINVFNADTYRIGSYSGTVEFLDAYLTEVNFIDGYALTPASFGQTNSNTGIWEPRQYTGPYGTNGFYLNFSDNSGTTSTTLGKDYSGNGNNWTPNNFSVTAGAGNDSLVDSPTAYGTDTGAGGEVRGNYCTLNPLDIYSSTSAPTFANGNLDASSSSVAFYRRAYGTFALFDNCYWEFTVGSGTLTNNAFGIASKTEDPYNVSGYYATEYAYRNTGAFVNNNSTIATYGSFSAGDIVRFAYSAGKLFVAINGTWQNSGNPAAGTGALVTGLTGSWKLLVAFDSTGVTHSLNAGQRPFAYTAPSGFKALCTQNLPTPTIQNGGQYFNPVLYNGNSSGASVTGVGFQPDFVWMKCRSTARNHELLDAVRGGSSTLFSNLTNAQATDQRISSFNSDGFTYTTNSNSANTGDTFVAWNWKANGAGSSNTAGSIQSTVSASTLSGFSIVTYTGNGSASATVGHGLGVTPSMIICKSRSATTAWYVKHTSLASNNNLLLAGTDAQYNVATGSGNGGLGNLSSSDTFGFLSGTSSADAVNLNGGTFVAYCFAAVAGYSTFGSYTGNGSSDGPFVYTGFRPALVLVKAYSTAGYDWYLMDDKRPGYNAISNRLLPNLSNAEITSGDPQLDIVSNGFKLRTGNSNASSVDYIYMALAANPFKYSLAR